MNDCTTSPSLRCRSRACRPRTTGLFALAAIVLVSACAVFVTTNQRAVAQYRGQTPVAANNRGAPQLPANAPALDYAASLSSAFRTAADNVLPSVVTIQRTAAVERHNKGTQHDRDGLNRGQDEQQPFGDLFSDPLLKRFFGDIPNMPRMPFPETPQGPEMSMGSGVIIDSSGDILTNSHVVEGGGKVVVRLHDGREFDATQVTTDPRTDLAVVRINATDLPAAQLGNSDDLNIGDWVIAVGQPFGLQDTVTAGIISAKGRGLGITAREEFLQTDAAINPGNSGGPLVNLRGEVVGINTAISSRTGGYQGVGFAIPMNLAKWVSDQLLEHGSVMRAYLGIGIQQVTPELAAQFGLTDDNGTVVTEVQSNSPAAEAGLKTGDVVVEFGGHAIRNPHEIQAFVEQAPIGSKQPLVVIRDGERKTLDVTVREQPDHYGLARGDSSENEPSQGEAYEELGIEVSDLTPEVAEQLGLSGVEGVLITSVRDGSPADLAGLSTSMVIERLGQTPVKNLDAFRSAMKDQSIDKGILFLVRSREGSRFVVIKVS